MGVESVHRLAWARTQMTARTHRVLGTSQLWSDACVGLRILHAEKLPLVTVVLLTLLPGDLVTLSSALSLDHRLILTNPQPWATEWSLAQE